MKLLKLIFKQLVTFSIFGKTNRIITTGIDGWMDGWISIKYQHYSVYTYTIHTIKVSSQLPSILKSLILLKAIKVDIQSRITHKAMIAYFQWGHIM